jgi:hypothetical protein
MTVKDRKLVIVDAPSEEALDVPSEKLKLEFEAEALV